MNKFLRHYSKYLLIVLLLAVAVSASAQLNVENPLGAKKDLNALIGLIAAWVFYISIPIIVMVIIYSGIKFITARGNPGEIQKAKDTLKYAVIGLAIVLIGRGFIDLIKDILSRG